MDLLADYSDEEDQTEEEYCHSLATIFANEARDVSAYSLGKQILQDYRTNFEKLFSQRHENDSVELPSNQKYIQLTSFYHLFAKKHQKQNLSEKATKLLDDFLQILQLQTILQISFTSLQFVKKLFETNKLESFLLQKFLLSIFENLVLHSNTKIHYFQPLQLEYQQTSHSIILGDFFVISLLHPLFEHLSNSLAAISDIMIDDCNLIAKLNNILLIISAISKIYKLLKNGEDQNIPHNNNNIEEIQMLKLRITCEDQLKSYIKVIDNHGIIKNEFSITTKLIDNSLITQYYRYHTNNNNNNNNNKKDSHSTINRLFTQIFNNYIEHISDKIILIRNNDLSIHQMRIYYHIFEHFCSLFLSNFYIKNNSWFFSHWNHFINFLSEKDKTFHISIEEKRSKLKLVKIILLTLKKKRKQLQNNFLSFPSSQIESHYHSLYPLLIYSSNYFHYYYNVNSNHDNRTFVTENGEHFAHMFYLNNIVEIILEIIHQILLPLYFNITTHSLEIEKIYTTALNPLILHLISQHHGCDDHLIHSFIDKLISNQFIDDDSQLISFLYSSLNIYLIFQQIPIHIFADHFHLSPSLISSSLKFFDPHLYFSIFVSKILLFDVNLLLDFLISNETQFLEYFICYLKYVVDNRSSPSFDPVILDVFCALEVLIDKLHRQNNFPFNPSFLLTLLYRIRSTPK